MRLGDVPKSERDRVFRYSPARAASFSLVAFLAVAALLWFGLGRRSGLAVYLAAAIVVGMLVMRRFILARFQPSNWLVRMGDWFVAIREADGSWTNTPYLDPNPTTGSRITVTAEFIVHLDSIIGALATRTVA